MLSANVVVFDNGSFVDTSGGLGAESDTVQASLSLLGHSVSTFTSTTAAGINSALTGQDVLLIPEQENGNLVSALSTSARNEINSFVSGGGGLIIHGFSTRADDFLNGVFGFGTAESSTPSPSTLTPEAAGTEFADDPASIPRHSGTSELFSLPVGSRTIYSDGSGATVALIPHGSGKIVFLGWDWFNAAPVGSQDGGWLGVLDSAVIEAAQDSDGGTGPLAIDLNGTDDPGIDFVATFTEDDGPVPIVDTDLIVTAGSELPGMTLVINFDAGSGSPPAYSEQGMTVRTLNGMSSEHLHLGNNAGNPTGDLRNHSGDCCSTPYQFDFGGAPFTVVSVDIELHAGLSNFTSSSGDVLPITGTGTLSFPSAGWTNITSFDWNQPPGSGDTVIDNLVIQVGGGGGTPGLDPVPEAEPNSTIATAQNIDGAGWNLNSDPNIANATAIPHVTIQGTGDGTFDYYSFTIANAGDTAIFDIDFGSTFGAGSMDTELFLYSSTGGSALRQNDDFSTSAGGGGSTSGLDSFIEHTFSAPGTYVIGVGEFSSSGSFGGITGNVPDTGDTYTLQVSIENHPLGGGGGTPGLDPIPEAEPNSTIATAQNIDGAGWNLNSDPNIANSTAVPHVTIEGTGDGTFDYYSFTIANAGDTATFDIDFGSTFGAGSMDTELFLYNSTGGSVLRSNDDVGTSAGGGGSTSVLDAFIEHTFSAAGTYVIGVGEFNSSGSFGGITGNVPDAGDTYTLQVSIENHPLGDGGGGGGDGMIDSAMVTITNLEDGAYESLSVDTTGTPIIASYDSADGQLKLTGTASAADYSTVLSTVVYNNTSQDPDEADRAVEFVVTRGSQDSPVATSIVSVVAVNDTPVISSISSSASFASKAEENEPVSVSGTFVDVDVSDTHTATVDWGDGSSAEMIAVTEIEPTQNGSFSGTHAYTTGGVFTVTVTIDDGNGGTDTTTTTVVVSGVGLVDGTLYVIGTSDADRVAINMQGSDTLKVHADLLPNRENFRTFDAASVQQIVAYLCEGDDHMTIAGNITIPAIVHAGADNDHIKGGGGPSILLGDGGDDMLIGGSGRNILIGGSGFDRLVGGNSDDVLLGGNTMDDGNDEALMAILAAWNNLNDSYAMRVAAIDALLTVLDDEEEDVLTGSAGRDLFYDGLDEVLTDLKTKNKPETVL